MGFSLYELGRFEEAVEQWAAASLIEEKSAFARMAMAAGLDSVGRTGEAIPQYSRAIDLDSRYADPRRLEWDIRWKPDLRKIVARLQSLPTL